MKDLVIRKPFGTEGLFFIDQGKDDSDAFCLQYIDRKLGIKLTIYRGGDTDGGSIPNLAKIAFDPLLDKTAHGFIFHDELWRHRVFHKKLFKELGITFSETNRIMQDIHKQAGCSFFETYLTRLGVRWGGYYKWKNPSEQIKNLKVSTLSIERI